MIVRSEDRYRYSSVFGETIRSRAWTYVEFGPYQRFMYGKGKYSPTWRGKRSEFQQVDCWIPVLAYERRQRQMNRAAHNG